MNSTQMGHVVLSVIFSYMVLINNVMETWGERVDWNNLLLRDYMALRKGREWNWLVCLVLDCNKMRKTTVLAPPPHLILLLVSKNMSLSPSSLLWLSFSPSLFFSFPFISLVLRILHVSGWRGYLCFMLSRYSWVRQNVI